MADSPKQAKSAQSNKRKPKQLGKYCVAGGPNNESCKNSSSSPGISMHEFPREDSALRLSWVQFVQRHRRGWQPSRYSCLCSAHFESNCYHQQLDFGSETKRKRLLDRSCAVPTIDTASTQSVPALILSPRERRKILRDAQSSTLATTITSESREENVHDIGESLSPRSSTSASPLPSIAGSSTKDLSTTGSTEESGEMPEENDDTEVSDNEDELEWAHLEGSSECSGDDEVHGNPDSSSTIWVDPGTKPANEPKFIVFFTCLHSLFSMFCFNCKSENPEVKMEQNGTMVTVEQKCKTCQKKPFRWRSQPFLLGRYPAGNLLLSFAILMAGASVSKVLLVFRHLGLAAYTCRTFFYHQKNFLFPAILLYWETYQANLIQCAKDLDKPVWCGDGRFDSMGHSAKYGVYTMFCCTLMKIVHFDLLQANQSGSSNAMELDGCKACFDFLLTTAGLAIPVFVSDRHRGICKYIRECHPGISHFFDQWHVAKGLVKKMIAASKENGCERIRDWTKGVRNHLYWCSTSTVENFKEMILAKWKSFMGHVANKHDNHPDPLFPSCLHEENLPRRKWIKVGTRSYDKLQEILLKKNVLSDIANLSPNAQTSALEGFHSTLNQWSPKMLSFSWLGTYCRHILAVLHFNENVQRQPQKSKDGQLYFHVTYPKFKLGDEVLREVRIPPTYDYVTCIMHTVLNTTAESLAKIRQKYASKVPEPLNRQFQDRLSKAEAIQEQLQRRQKVAEMHPPAEIQAELKRKLNEEHSKVQNKQPRRCKKCHQPKKGHPRSFCPTATQPNE